jgi:hypothetical protein
MRTIVALTVMTAMLSTRLPAAFERHVEDPRSAAMGGVGAACATPLWGSMSNPAAIPGGNQFGIALSFAPAPFDLDALRRSAIAFLIPFSSAAFSVSAVRYGFDAYHELTVNVAFGAVILPRVQAGMTAGYNRLSIEGYGSDAAMTFDCGFMWGPVENVTVGCTVSNVNAQVIGKTKEAIPQVFVLALAWSPSDDLLLASDYVKEDGYSPEMRVGFEFHPVGNLALRGGVTSNPTVYSAGIGIHLRPFGLDYAISGHPELGITHRFGLVIALDVK